MSEAIPTGRGRLIVLSGPSGSGKSTLIRAALESGRHPLRLAVSVTTRDPRGGEIDGTHYHFWEPGRFREAVEAGGFLEWAEVHGNFYGTPVEEVEPHLQGGVGVLLEIDVQGAEQVRARYPEAVTVFLHAPNYEQRLRERETDSEESIQRRLLNAERELARAGEYRHQLVNDDLDRAVAEFLNLI